MNVKGNVELTVNTDDDEIFTTIKIFGWDLWRIFRDEKKNILKIILKKDGIFREFKADIEYPHNQTEEGVKEWTKKN